MGAIVDTSVGRDVGPGVGLNVGADVGGVLKYVTVIFTSLPNSLHCPIQLSSPVITAPLASTGSHFWPDILSSIQCSSFPVGPL